MTELPHTEAELNIPTLANLRDIGGWPTRDGRVVRRGVLYRSVALNRIDDADLAVLGGLGLRTVYDLRTPSEADAAPDRLPPGAALLHLDVMADQSNAIPAHLADVFSDPSRVNERLGDGQAEALMADAYRAFITTPSALRAFGRLYSGVAGGEAPALFHCTAGKDRTGWASAALLTWLGVDAEHVMSEYLRTQDLLVPSLRWMFDRFAEIGGDTEILDAILGVRASYLETALDEMNARYGTVERYVSEGLGLSPQTQEALRAALLDG